MNRIIDDGVDYGNMHNDQHNLSLSYLLEWIISHAVFDKLDKDLVPLMETHGYNDKKIKATLDNLYAMIVPAVFTIFDENCESIYSHVLPSIMKNNILRQRCKYILCACYFRWSREVSWFATAFSGFQKPANTDCGNMLTTISSILHPTKKGNVEYFMFAFKNMYPDLTWQHEPMSKVCVIHLRNSQPTIHYHLTYSTTHNMSILNLLQQLTIQSIQQDHTSQSPTVIQHTIM